MDLKTLQKGLIIFIQLILTINPVTLRSVEQRECRQCKPGYYASRICSETYDTVCKPCPKGTYTPVQNVFNTCAPCTVCEVGEFVSHECSTKRDTVCESCAAVKDNINNNFIQSCVQMDDPGTKKLRLNDPSEVKLDKEDTFETIESSSDYTFDILTPHEGSGVDVNVELDNNNNEYPLTNDTDTIEGSGVVPEILESGNKTTTVSVILPDDGVEDIDNATTTTKEGVIEIGAGIVVQNITSDTSTDTDLNKPVRITSTTTTVKTIELDDSLGVVVDDKPTTKPEYTVEDTDDSIDVDVIVNDEPQTGASHTQHPRNSGGVSTGVVIAVGLVAALVFFIIGFVASRYWSRRRERTFNVQEAERRNGKTPVECSGIEYKDPENNIPGKTNVYGSLPSKTANGSTPEVRSQPDKPIVKSSAPPTGSQPNNKTDDDGDREWAGFSLSRSDSSGSLILRPAKPRAESEIRYIDEEEAETDALLPPTNSSPNQNNPEQQQQQQQQEPETDSTSGTDADSTINSNTDTQADERTPMISNNSNNNNS